MLKYIMKQTEPLLKDYRKWAKKNPDNIIFKKRATPVQGKGIFNSFYGKKHTEESKALMLRFGPKHSDEWKAELSKRWKGNKVGINPKTGKAWNFGTTHTKETKEKIKAKRALQVITDESRAKMSAAQTERWRLRKLNKEKK